ncbi:hypothetical protein RvY_06365 [Ramazzottius varieornatus]|uniref:Uncharacterized protein n=1 Tax=Ramazzottius varieornatus TaxID=947166 RepID=A0A1D1UYV8_RAMVA|nr:hypothetical protein RvY_06365 [Ramazzottius varieornatus]
MDSGMAEDLAVSPESTVGVEEIPRPDLDESIPPSKSMDRSLELKKEGNRKFGSGDFLAAIDVYSEALDICPENLETCKHRSILLSNRAASYLQLGIKENYEAAVADCTTGLELDPDNVKARVRRAKLNERLENFDEALADYKLLAERDRTIPGVVEACIRLPPLIEERNEKMKNEMMGKLKDLGNLVLKPFGLSTDNFKMEPQASGGYSMKFEPGKKK